MRSPETSRLLPRASSITRRSVSTFVIATAAITAGAILAVILVVTLNSGSLPTPAPVIIIPATTTTVAPAIIVSTTAHVITTSSAPITEVSETISTTPEPVTTIPPITGFLEQHLTLIDPLCGANLEPCSMIPASSNGKWAVHHNGLCWAWVGSCTTCAMNFTDVAIPGWGVVTDPHVWGLRPSKQQFMFGATPPTCGPARISNQRFTAGCASSVLTPSNMPHCDYCDAITSGEFTTSISLNAATADVWLVCEEQQYLSARNAIIPAAPVPLLCPQDDVPIIATGVVNCTYSTPSAANSWIQTATCKVTCNSTSIVLDPYGEQNDVNFTCNFGKWQTRLPSCRFYGCLENAIRDSNGASHMTPVGGTAATGGVCTSSFAYPGGVITCLPTLTWSVPSVAPYYHSCLSVSEVGCVTQNTCDLCRARSTCGWCDSLQQCVPGNFLGPQLPAYCPLGDFFYIRCYTLKMDGMPESELSEEIAVIDPVETLALGGAHQTVAQSLLDNSCINCDVPTRCYFDSSACNWSPPLIDGCLGLSEQNSALDTEACLCDRHHRDPTPGAGTCSATDCFPVTGVHSSTCSNNSPCQDDVSSVPVKRTHCECGTSAFGEHCQLAADATSSYNTLFNP